jgi:hypothetical protein
MPLPGEMLERSATMEPGIEIPRLDTPRPMTPADPTDTFSRLAALERRLASRERALRRTTIAALASALLLVPVLARTASVPNPDFEAGAVISAAAINENFAALAEQLTAVEQQTHGQIVFSDPVEMFETDSDSGVPIPDNQLQIETAGGAVRVELAASGTNSRLYVIGSAAGGPDPWLFAYVTFDRSADAKDWEAVGGVDFGGVPNIAGSTALPPSAFAIYDTPPAGTWFYRATIHDYSGAGPESRVRVQNVRLAAREIGSAP